MNSAPAIWNGPSGSSCINQAQNDPPSGAEKVRDAAFYALVSVDQTVKASVKTWILKQRAPTQLDFSNRTLWCKGSGQNPEYIFTISEWMNRILFAMDYIEILDANVFSAGERASLQSWFLAFADFTDTNVNISLTEYFPNRASDNYTPGIPVNYCCSLYYGSPQIAQVSRAYNNRRGAVMSAIANIGVKFNASAYIASAKKYAKEVIYFGLFPAGYYSDFLRWSDSGGSNPDKGLLYGFAILGHLIDVADVTGRIGDRELYNLVTSTGYLESAGGSKSVLFGMTVIANYYDHTYDRYGTDQAGNVGNPNYRIDSRAADGSQWVGDIVMARGNLFYQNNYIKGVYMRTGPGTIPYPATPNPNGAFDAWTGHSGQYPGALFMFGQMEGKVWPYLTEGSLPTINFAANPDTIAGSQSSTLSWSTSNATSCSASGGWTGTKSTSGTQTVTPTQTTTYTLDCTGSSGSATQSTTVSVSSYPPAAPSGVVITVGQQ